MGFGGSGPSVENMHKVRQNTAFVPQRKTLTKIEGISQGLALVPSGVFVLVARHGGETVAMLASFVQQAGFDPPMIVAAVQYSRPVRQMIQDSGAFALSVMSTDSKQSLKRFWTPPEGADPFDGLETQNHATGLPILSDAVGFLECRLHSSTDAGDHVLLIAEVINGGRIGKGDPMIRIRKNGFDY